jgi:hypothetical protein
MSRAVRRGSRRGLAVLLMGILLAVSGPRAAWAGVPYSLSWARAQQAGSCESADLQDHNGDAFFSVNQTPLPAYDVPGTLVKQEDGSESSRASAEFDSVLLYMGDNDFDFGVANASGDDSCVHSHEVVHLVSAPIGLNKPLFNVRRDGTAFTGATRVDLSLSEINPPLARDIENLKAAIAEEKRRLLQNASRIAGLARRLDVLRQLDSELSDLVRRPLDEISRIDLEEILDRYAWVVDDRTRDALLQLVDDLQQSVADLEDEMARLIDAFGAQADAVAGVVTQSARDAGWNPDDPTSSTRWARERCRGWRCRTSQTSPGRSSRGATRTPRMRTR